MAAIRAQPGITHAVRISKPAPQTHGKLRPGSAVRPREKPAGRVRSLPLAIVHLPDPPGRSGRNLGCVPFLGTFRSAAPLVRGPKNRSFPLEESPMRHLPGSPRGTRDSRGADKRGLRQRWRTVVQGYYQTVPGNFPVLRRSSGRWRVPGRGRFLVAVRQRFRRSWIATCPAADPHPELSVRFDVRICAGTSGNGRPTYRDHTRVFGSSYDTTLPEQQRRELGEIVAPVDPRVAARTLLE